MAYERLELRIDVPRLTSQHRSHVADPHRRTTEHQRRAGHPEERTGSHVRQRCAHEPLPCPGPHASGKYPVLARADRAQVEKPELRLIPAGCDPAEHTTAMTIDGV